MPCRNMRQYAAWWVTGDSLWPPNIEASLSGLQKAFNSGEIDMKLIAVSAAVLALAMTSPFAFAHKHKGWGCHAHADPEVDKWVKVHCGNGSR